MLDFFGMSVTVVTGACAELRSARQPRAAVHTWSLLTKIVSPINHQSYKLIADLRTSPIDESGSRAPSFGAIHFFSFAIMSSNSFLSSALGM